MFIVANNSCEDFFMNCPPSYVFHYSPFCDLRIDEIKLFCLVLIGVLINTLKTGAFFAVVEVRLFKKLFKCACICVCACETCARTHTQRGERVGGGRGRIVVMCLP